MAPFLRTFAISLKFTEASPPDPPVKDQETGNVPLKAILYSPVFSTVKRPVNGEYCGTGSATILVVITILFSTLKTPSGLNVAHTVIKLGIRLSTPTVRDHIPSALCELWR